MRRLRPGLASVLALILTVLSGAPALGQDPAQVAAPADGLPRVVVIATGGTIAGRSEGGQLTGAQLVSAVPQLAQVARLEVEEFSRIGSSAMTPDHWLRLSRRVNELFATDPDIAGIVVTHGTDTMEETGYFLHLTVEHERPVVMVGSMRNASAVSADGPANLLSGVRVAAAPESAGRGVLVVLNDEIHSARDVRKTDNNRVDTFVAAEGGALGIVDADQIVYRRLLATEHTTSSDVHVRGEVVALPNVPIIADYAGSDAAGVRALVGAEVAAVVVQAFGGGRASPEMRRAVAEVAESGIPVVLGSRVPEGRVMNGVAAPERGVLAAGDMPPHRVRVLLLAALTRTRTAEELQRLLDTH